MSRTARRPRKAEAGVVRTLAGFAGFALVFFVGYQLVEAFAASVPPPWHVPFWAGGLTAWLADLVNRKIDPHA